MTQSYQEKWALGLMSGTSLDGIDIAALKTDGQKIFETGPEKFYPYDRAFAQALQSILNSSKQTDQISTIETQLTLHHAEAVKDFLKSFGLKKEEIDLIGFHGHTILHESPKKFPKGRTWQIGCPQLLAQEIGLPVIAHLRYKDVEHGGEGAPLVPLYHQALLNQKEKPAAVLNIGGVANVTWVGGDNLSDLLAFDTGPGNALLNDWIFEKKGVDFDQDGRLSQAGKPCTETVSEFLNHPYFQFSAPKSADRNQFHMPYPSHLSVEDTAATLAECTIQSILKAQNLFPKPVQSWYLSGGGRHNKFFKQRLKELLYPTPVFLIDQLGINGDFVEAQAFAFLAVRSDKGLPLTLPSTTGVPHPLTGGKKFLPLLTLPRKDRHV